MSNLSPENVSSDTQNPPDPETSDMFFPFSKKNSRGTGWFERCQNPKLPLNRLGLNGSIGVLALVLTVLFYASINWFAFTPWLNLSAHYAKISTREHQSDQASELIQLTGSSPELEGWIRENINSKASSSVRQVMGLIQSVQASGNVNDTKAMEKQLYSIICGKPSRPLLFYFCVEQITGKEALAMVTNESWLSSLKEDPLGDEKKVFLEKLLDLLIAHQSVAVHAISRVNGWIQFITVFLGFLIGCILWFRYIKISALPDRLAASGAFPIAIPSVQTIEEGVYRPLGFMISTLPSLGFIGTVLGMGEALLQANKLFTTTDKQAAIGKMTQELGFAFDTTLIALIIAILAGTALTWVKTRELIVLSGLRAEETPAPIQISEEDL